MHTLRVDVQRRDDAAKLNAWTTDEFYRLLVDSGIRRAYVVYENGEFTVSHASPLLASVRAFLELSHDFSSHEALFIGRDDGTKTPFFAFVHDTRRGLSQGGLRMRQYRSTANLLSDGLRLSKGMTQKNALAGLNWGGGKGIIAMPTGYGTPQQFRDDDQSRDARTELFREYGRFVASLRGVYYTAEDMFTNTHDMNVLLGVNRFTTCIHSERGGSGNPSPFTARGIFAAMRAAWRFLRKTEDMRRVRVAVQGVGNVGQPLVELLYKAGASIVIADPVAKAIATTVATLGGARIARCATAGEAYRDTSANLWILDDPQAIFDVEADVFSPCGIGEQLNSDTIPRLKVSLVCGAANNQLRDAEADAERLNARGITYVPDFLCNRMGIMNCADEWLGYLEEDVRLAAERVYPDTLRVLRHARDLRITTQEAAESLANVAASELHPVLGHRGRRIIDFLISSSWLSTEPARDHQPKQKSAELHFAPAIDEPLVQREAEQNGFAGSGRAIAATPISAASRPHLGVFLAPLLMDIEVRRRAASDPRRVIGVDHGGLALQNAIEISLPYARTDTSRSDFVRVCRDRYDANDAAIRRQLHQAGIGFDAERWLDTMAPGGEAVVRAAYYRLRDIGRVSREPHVGWRCPHCDTVLVASDTEPKRVRDTVFLVRLSAGDTAVECRIPLIEDLVGATAIVVRPGGPYARFAGTTIENPVTARAMPVLAGAGSTADAALLVPFGRSADQDFLAARGSFDVVPIYDADGRVPIGVQTYDREEARSMIMDLLGDAVETKEIEDKEVRRCMRCRTIVDADSSIQQIVDFGREAEVLRQLIASGGVTFSRDRWRTVALAHLDEMNRWCISRQSWWGNEIPDSGGEVFSPWFSLAAWSLQAAGWPDVVAPEPVGIVYTDPEFLTRWILPSQCLALAVYGRPAFREIRVHGTAHVVERAEDDKRRVPGSADNAPDEERFLFRTVRRPMRTQYGNVVEPGSLVTRFGADALRLWYVLSLQGGATDIVTLAEGHARAARRAVRQVNVGLSAMLDRGGDAADAAVIAELDRIVEEAERAWDRNDLTAIGDAFLKAATIVSRHGRRGGATAGTAAALVERLYAAFHPICPFIVTKFRDLTQRPAPVGVSVPEPVVKDSI